MGCRASRAGRSRRWAQPVGEIFHFLTCPPLEPIKLPRAGIVRIGRGADCEVVLPHGAVSRLHAQLWWSGSAYLLRDDGSLNGTYVNRRRVNQVELRHGDRLRIGPFTLKFVASQVPALPAPVQWADTEMLTGVAAKEPAVALSGRIEEMELSEVVQFVGMSRKTGVLKVRAPDSSGTLVFQDGELIDATSADRNGEAAVFELLKLREGSFEFFLHSSPPTRTIQRSTLHLLLETHRLMDEAQALSPEP